MSLSSSVADLVPIGASGRNGAPKPRRADAGADFGQALQQARQETRQDAKQEARQEVRHQAKQELRDNVRPEQDKTGPGRSAEARARQDDHAAREAPPEARPDHQDQRAEPSPRSRHGDNRRDVNRGHDADSAPKDDQTSGVGESVEAASGKGDQGDASDPSSKSPASDAVANDKPAVDGLGVLAVTLPVPVAPAPSDTVLAFAVVPQAAGEQIDGVPTPVDQGPVPQMPPQLAVQAAAPAVAALATEADKPADADTPASAIAAPSLSLPKGAVDAQGLAVAGEAVPDSVAKGGTGADASEPAQTAIANATRDFAKVLDQAQATQSTTTGTAVATPSPVAAAGVDAVQQSRPATPAEALARADAPVPLQAVAVEIGMRAMRGSKEFSIRLDPEDLGRIDVRLEISEAGQVQAKVVVERVETLALLQRDAKTLERAFDQAGLKTSADGLQFSLRDPGQQARDNNKSSQQGRQNTQVDKGPDKAIVDDMPLRPAQYRMSRISGLDIRI